MDKRILEAIAAEEDRIENLISPLYDLWLRFESAFTRLAVDRFDISSADAEQAAKMMHADPSFASLLRRIASERNIRLLYHQAEAIWAAEGTREGEGRPLSVVDILTEYPKLREGQA